jgi:uncharacterized protein YcfJ
MADRDDLRDERDVRDETRDETRDELRAEERPVDLEATREADRVARDADDVDDADDIDDSDDTDRGDDRTERRAATVEGHDAGEVAGESVGGLAGAASGALIGSGFGPVGTVIGALAGALGGWWAGRELADTFEGHTTDDEYYRRHFETAGTSNLTYDRARPAYQLGDVASRNPEYRGRTFDDVEPQIRQGWTGDVEREHGSWEQVRTYVSEGYYRGSTRGDQPMDRRPIDERASTDRVQSSTEAPRDFDTDARA